MYGWARINLLGTLGADAEIRMLPTGQKKMELRVAVTESWKDKAGQRKERTTWFRCEDWVNRPDFMVQKLVRGSVVAIDGSLMEESWEKDGQRHFRTVVRVDRLEALGVMQRSRGGEQRFADGSGSVQTPDDDPLPF